MQTKTVEQLLKTGRITSEQRNELIEGYLFAPEGLSDLFELCYDEDQHAAFQAAWILDGVLRKNLLLLIPYWETFLSRLESVHNPSVLRSFAKICELVTEARWKKKSQPWKDLIRTEHCQTLTQSLFDWLISDQKVAVKVFAMTGLFHLGNSLPWIDEELAAVIQNQIPESSAGFRSRGGKILKALHKRKAA